MHGTARGTGKRDRAGTVVLRAATCLRRRGVGEVAADISGIKLNRVNTRVHVKPGWIRGLIHNIGISRSVDTAIVPDDQYAGRARQERECVLVNVHRPCAAAVGITARRIVPDSACSRCEPHFEGIEKDAVRIIWINRHALVIPVLRIIALAAGAIPE